MSWESEFETALTAALDGDATLTALVATSKITQGEPFKSAAVPSISWHYRDNSPQTLNRPGKVDITLTFDVYAAKGSDDAILDALRNVLDSRERTAAGNSISPISLTNYQCKVFRYLRSFRIATGNMSADANSKEVVQRQSEWSVRLYRTS